LHPQALLDPAGALLLLLAGMTIRVADGFWDETTDHLLYSPLDLHGFSFFPVLFLEA